jgi:hypothetical protein
MYVSTEGQRCIVQAAAVIAASLIQAGHKQFCDEEAVRIAIAIYKNVKNECGG